MTQQELDQALDLTRTLPVEISADGPLPVANAAYDPIRGLPATWFEFTARELLHAIGSKTAALPSSAQDDCLRASLLYTYILDLSRDGIFFKPGIESDLKTPRSQEIGIAFTCLVASRHFGVPWDQLGPLPGPGLRFDYRGTNNGFDGIFESKGTGYRGNQSGQIAHGLQKKNAHHQRGERFDVELVVSACIGTRPTQGRIVIADPNFDDLAEIFDAADNRFFRLRHYARTLQFIGLPKSAFELNRYALRYLKGERQISTTIQYEKEIDGGLDIELFAGRKYVGRWFKTVAPEGSKRYPKKRYGEERLSKLRDSQSRLVFQGLRKEIFDAGMYPAPFEHEMLSREDVLAERSDSSRPISLLPDGTIQVFQEG